MKHEQKTLVDLAKEAFTRAQARVGRFIEAARKLELSRPENELEFVCWALQNEDDAVLVTYLKKELADIDSDAIVGLPTSMLLDVVAKAAVDRLILDRWHIDVHTY